MYVLWNVCDIHFEVEDKKWILNNIIHYRIFAMVRTYYRRRRRYYGGYRRNASYAYARPAVSKKRKTRKRTAVKKKTIEPKNSVMVPAFTLAQANPFSAEAVGCRVPDDSTAPSSTFVLREEYALTNSGNGAPWARALFCWPQAKYYACAAQGTSPTAVDWGAAYATNCGAWSKQATVVSQYNVVRPVAHGVRICCSLAPTSTTGFVHMALYTPDTFNAATWALPTTTAAMREMPFYKKVTLASLTQSPLYIVNKYLDETAFRYSDPSSPGFAVGGSSGQEFQTMTSWMGILIFVEGHSVSTLDSVILDVDICCHFEGQSKYSAIRLDQTAERKNIRVMDATGEAVANSDATTYEQDVPSRTVQFMQGVAQEAGNVGRGIWNRGGRDWFIATVTDRLFSPREPGLQGINDVGRLAG